MLDAINRGQGVSEILAINDHEFLVIERDNRSNLQTPPQAPTRKTIYKIDINGATDVSGLTPFPPAHCPRTSRPSKRRCSSTCWTPSSTLRRQSPRRLKRLPGAGPS